MIFTADDGLGGVKAVAPALQGARILWTFAGGNPFTTGEVREAVVSAFSPSGRYVRLAWPLQGGEAYQWLPARSVELLEVLELPAPAPAAPESKPWPTEPPL